MYAVVAVGGKQTVFRPGDQQDIDKVAAEVGDEISFSDVLLYHDGQQLQTGQPTVAGVVVKAKVVAQHRDKKVKIIKFKRRKHHLKYQGHRQQYTRVEIIEIQGAAKKKAAAKRTKKAD